MTKYEWERQLKKGISGLPKAEQQRVLDYYNELFADKIDAGLREQYIISEFGNPYDVANKILVDYYNGDKENPEVDAYIYADSDDIDSAFDDEPAPATVQAPQRKTWAERREEKRDAHKQAHYEQTYQHNTASDVKVDVDVDDKKAKKGARSVSGLIAVIAVLLYFVLGACFNMWHPAWLIFLLIPCVITLIEAYRKRNWKIFAYPVFVAFLFLIIGFTSHRWHPTWILFITIPVYYVLGDFITKNAHKDTNKQPRNQQPQKPVDEPVTKPAPQKAKKAKESDGNGFARAMTIIAKILLTLCLVWVSVVVISFVVSLFVGGIGMIISGISLIVTAGMGIVSGSANLVMLGSAIATLGLGLICTFGMAMLFKPCFKMCKTFVNTIKKTVNGKEAE